MIKINTEKGFTLVELMVVVSIISLLAAVVVAGLTDARGGAKNNKRNELVRQYVISLGLHQGEYGDYPSPIDPEDTVCLGSYPNGCYVVGPHNQDTSVNSQINQFAPGLPASLETTTVGANSLFGITYKCGDENCINYELTWFLEGSGSDAECFGGAQEFPETPEGSPIKFCTYFTNNSN